MQGCPFQWAFFTDNGKDGIGFDLERCLTWDQMSLKIGTNYSNWIIESTPVNGTTIPQQKYLKCHKNKLNNFVAVEISGFWAV